GVILNLALWFAIHTLFREVRTVGIVGGGFDVPVLTSLNLPALVLVLGAAVAVFRFKAGMIPVLFACAGLGAAYVLIV
ncbi:MAG: chromate transporter, partial [Alphaproteobacteria bacterium]|nr:chromate transporter [Alphaproteobacteria bacterium]